MTGWVFIATLLAEILLGASLILTLCRPPLRIWPPPKRNSWQYFFTWGLTLGSWAGILTLGVLDWNRFVLGHWVRLPLGIAFIAASLVLVLWAVKTLGFKASQGLGGILVQEGPYQITRNPQYVADIVMLGGCAVLANSIYVWISCGVGMAWFVLAPFTEEPWLHDQLGPDYDHYRERVPRFVSFRGMDRTV